MRRLMLLRHAKTERPEPGERDRDRKLTKRGRADAPLTLFIWGAQRILPVKVTDCSITEEAYDQALNPIRAKVGLGLRVLSYNDLSITNPGYYVFLAHQIVKETMSVVSTASDLTAVIGSNVKLG